MGALANALRRTLNPRALTLSQIPSAFFNHNPAATGIDVTEESSIQSTAVFRCVNLIAGIFASLPARVVRHTPEGSEPVDHSDLDFLLNESPAEVLGSFQSRHLAATSFLLWGNSYQRIARRRRRDSDVGLEFLYLPPALTTPELKKSRIRYEFNPEGSEPETFDQSSILHVPGLGFDGVKGKSVIRTAGKEPLGLAFAMERMLGKLHANAARPSGVVTLGEELTPEALKRMKQAFSELTEGLDNTGRTIFLDKGSKWDPMVINPVDLETMAARRMSVADIARLFGTPLFLLAETEKSTSWGSGLWEQTAAFLRYTIRPIVIAFENEYARKLHLSHRRNAILKADEFIEYSLDAFLRGDPKARAEFYASGVQNGWLRPNEARRRENLPPDEQGDVLYANGTLQPLGSPTANPPQPPKE